jgi:hypothetical protein
MSPAARIVLAIVTAGGSAVVAACGGGTSSGSGGTNTTTPVANTVSITAGQGPSTVNPYVNGVFVSVTVCVPGSSQCVTVPDVLVDTGSSGLRILSSALANLPLPKMTTNGATIASCVQFVDLTFNWGPVALADVKMAGEVASSLPIALIADTGSGFPDPPSGCANGGIPANSLDTLSANGILGLAFYVEDCGSACAPGTRSNPGLYYACSGSSCQVTTVALANQVQNPVAAFASDNNGVVLSLPALPEAGLPSTTGTLVFGIGSQSDNALGSAIVQTADAHGSLTTQFEGVSYGWSFIDSGSNGLYFLDSKTTGFPECGSFQGLYCPQATQNLSATNVGANSRSRTVTFRVANAENLPEPNWIFDDLAGPSSPGAPSAGLPSLYFDWGLPFFFGRTVYIAIEGRSTPGGVGPFWAY